MLDSFLQDFSFCRACLNKPVCKGDSWASPLSHCVFLSPASLVLGRWHLSRAQEDLETGSA